MECVLSNPHPITGSYQTCTLIASGSQNGLLSLRRGKGFPGWVQRLALRALGISELRQNTITIDGYDARLRPTSVLVETEFVNTDGGTTVMESRASMVDDDGLTEAFEIDAVDFLPSMQVSPTPLDLNQDGMSDHMSFPYHIRGLRVFLPLGDTDGDGRPDTIAFDFDRDGQADPDFPLFPFLAGAPNPEVELKLHFAQFGDGSAGAVNIFSQITLFNLDSTQAANVKIILKDDDGNPLTVDLNGEVVEGEKDLVIPPGGLSLQRTDGQGPLTVGSVTVCSDRAVAGVILFGGSAGLAGVGISHVMAKGFVAPIESNRAEATNTGIAVKNLESGQMTLQLALCDSDGNLLATAELTLVGMGHRAIFVDQIEWQPVEGVQLDFSDFRGLLKATSSAKVAATVIQTRPGELATLPVAPNFNPLNSTAALVAQAPLRTVPLQNHDLNQKLYFAQFGDGALNGLRLFSQLILFNLTASPANTKVILKDDAGNPLTVDLNGETVSGEIDLVIPAGALRILQTDGEGELIAGSATVCSDQAVAGVILFGGSAGVAGVGSSALLVRGFEAPMETNSASAISTGIAVFSLESEEMRLQLRLGDEVANQIAAAKLVLPPMGHRALFVDQINWQPEKGEELDFSDFDGLLKVSSSGKAAATVIQTRPGVFATLPVVPSLN